jgi:hypothetical protein
LDISALIEQTSTERAWSGWLEGDAWGWFGGGTRGGGGGGTFGGKYCSNCFLFCSDSKARILPHRTVFNWLAEVRSFSRAVIFVLARLRSVLRNCISRSWEEVASLAFFPLPRPVAVAGGGTLGSKEVGLLVWLEGDIDSLPWV